MINHSVNIRYCISLSILVVVVVVAVAIVVVASGGHIDMMRGWYWKKRNGIGYGSVLSSG